MLIERYPPSKYTKDLGGDMFISPPSDKSGSTFSESADPRDYKVFESLLRVSSSLARVMFPVPGT